MQRSFDLYSHHDLHTFRLISIGNSTFNGNVFKGNYFKQRNKQNYRSNKGALYKVIQRRDLKVRVGPKEMRLIRR